jgi:hypothetical protein
MFAIQTKANTLYPQDIFSYDQKTRTYIALKDISIAPNDTLFIQKGVRIAFSPFTGIELKGALQCIGTPDQQIIFTSKNSLTGGGAAYDWKGINLYPSSILDIEHATIQYSSFAITSCGNNVNLNNVSFHQNGKFNLKIGERIIEIKDNIPFSFGRFIEQKSIADALPNNNEYKEKPTIPIKDALIPKGLYLYVPATLGLLTGSAIFIANSLNDRTEYQNYRPGNQKYDNATSTERRETYEEMKQQFAVNVSLSSIFGICAIALGTYSVYYTITF